MCLENCIQEQNQQDNELLELYLTESSLGLQNPSPYVRTASLSILSAICHLSPDLAIEAIP